MAWLTATIACAGALTQGIASEELALPVDKQLAGRWVSHDRRFNGRLEAFLAPRGEGEYELTFKVTGSPAFTPEGRPYPDEGVYPLRLERTDGGGLTFTYRQPFPRTRALFFIPRGLTYRVRLEGSVEEHGGGRWQAAVSDHNLSLAFRVTRRSIIGTYDYDGRWEQAKGSFLLFEARRTIPSRNRRGVGDASNMDGHSLVDG